MKYWEWEITTLLKYLQNLQKLHVKKKKSTPDFMVYGELGKPLGIYVTTSDYQLLG